MLRDRTPEQKWLFAIFIYFMALGTAGLIVNPDFSAGADATAKSFQWVDWNGWHAVSTYSVAVPLLAGALSLRYTAPMALAVGAGVLGTGLWGVLDDRPFQLIYFRHQAGDVVLHTTFGIALLVIGATALRRQRAQTHAAAAAA